MINTKSQILPMLVTAGKTIKSKYGQFDVSIPRDRDSSFQAIDTLNGFNEAIKASLSLRYKDV